MSAKIANLQKIYTFYLRKKSDWMKIGFKGFAFFHQVTEIILHEVVSSLTVKSLEK